MKIAVTVWEGRISPVFDACREVCVLDIEGDTVVSSSLVELSGDRPDVKVESVVRLGVELLICGAISEPLQSNLLARGIDVIGFVAGGTEEVVSAYLAGELPDRGMAMPGCRAKRRRRRRRRCRGRDALHWRNMN